MAGAKHIVQRVVLQASPSKNQGQQPHGSSSQAPPAGTLSTQFRGLAIGNSNNKNNNTNNNNTNSSGGNTVEKARQAFDARKDILFLEYMRRGNLNTYLEKMGAASKRFPDQVLWQIFHCRKFPSCLHHVPREATNNSRS